MTDTGQLSTYVKKLSDSKEGATVAVEKYHLPTAWNLIFEASVPPGPLFGGTKCKGSLFLMFSEIVLLTNEI